MNGLFDPDFGPITHGPYHPDPFIYNPSIVPDVILDI